MAGHRFRSFTAENAVRAAEAALSEARDRPVSLRDVVALSDEGRRNLILRASAVDPSGEAAPIIVKATRAAGYDPTQSDAFETSGLVKEWSATTLLSRRVARRGGSVSLLAADVAEGVLVFADLGGDLLSLVTPLLQGTPDEAEQALTTYACALAALHAETTGCREAHAAIVRETLPASRMRPPGEGWIERIGRKAETLLGGALPEDELALIAGHLAEPGPWLALVHGDPCPDNVLMTPDGAARLIDFEFAKPGHALLDAAYWRMGFPTCWCAGHVPGDVAARVEHAYRAAIADAIPVASDDAAFRRESTLICAAWLLGVLGWLLEDALKEETTWGIASRRSRILYYLQTAIAVTAGPSDLPGLHEQAIAWLGELQGSWEGCAPLAVYPAFATGRG